MSATCLINETSNHGTPFLDEPPEEPDPSEEHYSNKLQLEPITGMDLYEEESSMVPSQLVSGLSLNKPIPCEKGSALTVCGYGSWRRQKMIDKSINVHVPCKQPSLPRLEHKSQPSKALSRTKGSTTSKKLLVGSSQNSSVNDETGSTLLICGCGLLQRPTMTDGPDAVVAYYETNNLACSADKTILLPTLRPFTSPSEGHESQMNWKTRLKLSTFLPPIRFSLPSYTTQTQLFNGVHFVHTHNKYGITTHWHTDTLLPSVYSVTILDSKVLCTCTFCTFYVQFKIAIHFVHMQMKKIYLRFEIDSYWPTLLHDVMPTFVMWH